MTSTQAIIQRPVTFDELVEATMELHGPLSVQDLYHGSRARHRHARDLVCWYAHERCTPTLSYDEINQEMGRGGRSGIAAAVGRVSADAGRRYGQMVDAWVRQQRSGRFQQSSPK